MVDCTPGEGRQGSCLSVSSFGDAIVNGRAHGSGKTASTSAALPQDDENISGGVAMSGTRVEPMRTISDVKCATREPGH